MNSLPYQEHHLARARSRRQMNPVLVLQRLVNRLGLKPAGNEMGVAILERRSRERGIRAVGPDRCEIASSDQSRLRDKPPGVVRWPAPSARSSAFRSAPCDL